MLIDLNFIAPKQEPRNTSASSPQAYEDESLVTSLVNEYDQSVLSAGDPRLLCATDEKNEDHLRVEQQLSNYPILRDSFS